MKKQDLKPLPSSPAAFPASPSPPRGVFPWFILGFLAMAVLSSVGVIPAAAAAALKKVSKFLMVTALAAVGLNTSFAEMKKSGAAPMVHGFLISALVVLVALAVEYFMGILPF